jgi:[ribosomal protein S18]-alanine N-acetyltransferase
MGPAGALMVREAEAPSLTVRIEPMRRKHLKSVLRIEQQVYPRPWSAALFHSELALRSTRSYFVAKVGRRLVGYAGIMVTLDESHVTTIAVDPTRHREKIGTRLMLQLARESVAMGATALTLEVRVSNKGAQDLYRRFGFGPVGVRKNYYQEINEDALVMWAHEIDQPEYQELLASIERTIPGETIVIERETGL